MTQIVKPVEVDWFRLLADLKAQGYTLKGVARATGIHYNAISLLYNRRTQAPSEANGRALTELWHKAHGIEYQLHIPTVDCTRQNVTA